MAKLVFLRKAGYGISLRDNGFSTVNPDQERKFKRLNPNIVWRWGYSGTVNWRLTQDQISRLKFINVPAAISRIGDKFGFLKRCAENEIDVPEVYLEDFPDDLFLNRNTIILGRKFNHFGGSDIKVFTNGQDLLNDTTSDYYVKYLPKQREYRIYSFLGRIVEVQEKIPDDPSKIAWNHSQGSHFVNVRYDDWPKNALKKVLKAAKLFGIDYCAWDVINYNHRFYILEGNTAPTISGEYNLSIMRKMVDYLENVYPNIQYLDIPTGNGWRDFIHPAVLEV